MSTLQQVLADALRVDCRTKLTLRGGLILIAYPPEDGNRRRIVAARFNSTPSDRELQVVRRELLIITQDRPLTTVGDFQRLAPNGPWNAAEIHINAPSAPAANGR